MNSYREPLSPYCIARRGALASIACSAVAPGLIWAQSDRPVRLVVNTSAGTGTDAAFRAIQPALARALGQSVVVENMAGAGGMISWQAVARGQPDGFTLAATSSNLVIQPHLMSAPPIDIMAQLSPVAIIGEVPVVIVVNPAKMNVRNAQEFIAQLKTRGDDFNYGSGGQGTTLHLAVELLLEQIGAQSRHVPYKGGGQVTTDLLGGQIDFAALAVSVALPHIRTGALRAVGLCTAQRVPLAPDLPTFVEQGLGNYVFQVWLGVAGPKGMAPDAVRKLNAALATALSDPAVKESMAKQGNVVQVTSPEEMQKTMLQDFARYGAIVKRLGLKS